MSSSTQVSSSPHGESGQQNLGSSCGLAPDRSRFKSQLWHLTGNVAWVLLSSWSLCKNGVGASQICRGPRDTCGMLARLTESLGLMAAVTLPNWQTLLMASLATQIQSL